MIWLVLMMVAAMVAGQDALQNALFQNVGHDTSVAPTADGQRIIGLLMSPITSILRGIFGERITDLISCFTTCVGNMVWDMTLGAIWPSRRSWPLACSGAGCQPLARTPLPWWYRGTKRFPTLWHRIAAAAPAQSY